MLEEYFFTCPFCWQEISMLLDTTVSSQDYVEDCEICCNPIAIRYSTEDGAVNEFLAEPLQQ
ncbi:MAG: CPXCG motif-containing cysteine-rich protein [Candidatus Obscuribacterales bacterium]|nr:CPXCG motif-containing cysteine-rich protein [Candidatus Obscuribacterales bacterium]